MTKRVYFEAASRPRGDEHMPVILEWHEIENHEQKLASVQIITSAPCMTRKAARQSARAIIKEKGGELWKGI